MFADYFESGNRQLTSDRPSWIEGIGRQRVEPSFIREVIDRMERVDNASSLAAMQLASDRLGRSVGGSTGTNLCGAFRLIAEMLERGETGSVVTLICDGGERYRHSYYDDAWLASRGLDLGSATPGVGALPVDGDGRGPRRTVGPPARPAHLSVFDPHTSARSDT